MTLWPFKHRGTRDPDEAAPRPVRIGSPMDRLGEDAIRRRILMTLEVPRTEQAIEADYVWQGTRRRTKAGGADFPGLRAAIETGAYPTLAAAVTEVIDFVHLAVPFTHFAIVMGSMPSQGVAVLETNLKQFFLEDFGRWALRAPRIRCFVDPRAGRDYFFIHFGFGVFVPAPGERPVARLQVRRPQEIWSDLCLPDAQGKCQPTGFYRGQSGLGFSYSPRSSLAFGPGLGLSEEHLYYLGRLDRTEPAGMSPAGASVPGELLRIWRPTEGGYAIPRKFRVEAERSELGLGMRVLTASDERPLLQLRLAEDDSAHRLLATPPPGPYLELEGLVFPDCGRRLAAGNGARRVEEWWLDLDAEGWLAVGPLRGRTRSVAGSHGNWVRLFDHAAFDNLIAGRVSPGKSLTLSAAVQGDGGILRVKDLGDREWHYLVSKDGGFGYVALPPGEWIPCAELLSWVDACCGVRMRGSNRDREDEGLAALAFGEDVLQFANDVLYVRTVDLGRVRVISSAGQGAPVKPRRSGKSADGFVLVTAMPGEHLLLGCCLFALRIPGR